MEQPANVVATPNDNANIHVRWQSPTLFVSSWHEQNVLFLEMRGELDMHTVPALKQAIVEGLAHDACDTIVADMSAVTFVDSNGYGVFISAMQTLRFRGKGSVHLAACQPPVARMLAVIRLDRVFTMHPTLDAVRESLGLAATA